jgi:fructose-1,6-bisphosphatase
LDLQAVISLVIAIVSFLTMNFFFQKRWYNKTDSDIKRNHDLINTILQKISTANEKVNNIETKNGVQDSDIKNFSKEVQAQTEMILNNINKLNNEISNKIYNEINRVQEQFISKDHFNTFKDNIKSTLSKLETVFWEQVNKK